MSNTAAVVLREGFDVAYLTWELHANAQKNVRGSRAKSLGKSPQRFVSTVSIPPLPPDIVVREGAEPMSRPPHIRALLLDAFVKIREFFGRSTLIAIDRFVEPDESEAEAILYIVVGTKLSSEEADAAYDRFLEDWWLANVDRGRNQVHLSVEFL